MNLTKAISRVLKGRSNTAATLQSLISRIIILSINLATGIISARALGPQGRGELAAIIMWPQFLSYMMNLGLPTSLLYNLKLYPQQKSKIFGAVLLLGTVLGCLATLTGIFLLPFWLSNYSSTVISNAQWFMLFAPLSLNVLLFTTALEAEGDFTLANRARYITPLITLILLVSLTWLQKISSQTVALAYAIPLIVIFLWLFVYLWRYFHPVWNSLVYYGKKLISYGVKSYGVDLLAMLSLQINPVLVMALLSPDSMGLYSIAISLTSILEIFQSSIVAVLLPRIVNCSIEEILELTGRTAKINLVLTSLVSLFLVVVTPLLLTTFYGSEFQKSGQVIPILLIEVTISGTIRILAQAFAASGKPIEVAIFQFLGVILSFPLMLFFIPNYGLLGAGIALFSSTIIRLICILCAYPLVLKVFPPSLFLTKKDFNWFLDIVREKTNFKKPFFYERFIDRLHSWENSLDIWVNSQQSQQMKQTSSKDKQFINLKPAPAWLAILGLFLLSALLILFDAAKSLNFVFPGGAFLVGLFLYFRYPVLYVGFTWWLWLLTPLFRRIVDYRSSFTEPSPILIAPLLVTFICSITFIKYLPQLYQKSGLPFILCAFSIIYGFCTGIIQNPINTTIVDFLNAISPIVFGFYLFINWDKYPLYRQNIQNVFFWGVSILGIYGIWQYLVAPDWDCLWLKNIDAFAFGLPEPFKIRVWSTMNSPQPFAAVMMAGLLVLLGSNGSLRFPVSGIGYIAFLLSLARSAWMSWAIGLLFFLPSLKKDLRRKLVISITIAMLCMIPLATIEPFSSTIGDRIGTLSNGNDVSFQERAAGYTSFFSNVFSQYIGKGLGQETEFGMGSRDSGILNMFFSLGWLGAIPYLCGLFLLFWRIFQSSQIRFDPLASAFRAIALGTLTQIGLNIVTMGVIGVVLWGFLGLSMAAQTYYLHQSTYKLQQNVSEF
jgi:O-antigen/teichoic acid export membrane protein